MFRTTWLIPLLLCGGAHADPVAMQRIVTSIPAATEDGAPIALQEMEEGVVYLDLRIAPEFDPSIQGSDGTYESLGECGFGPLEADMVSLNTGSNHLVMDVRMGTPEQHAANMLSCEYSPEHISDDGFGHTTRLTGCFFARSSYIPTAIYWSLNPLPASACGFGD